MEHRSQASIGGELEDKVQTPLDAEPKQPSRVGMVNVSDDSELGEEISDPLLFSLPLG